MSTTDAIPSASMTPILPTRVGKHVYALNPSNTVVNADVSVKPYAPPQLILIFGWMEGKLGHLTKYMSTYSDMYPRALQVLCTSDMSVSWSRKSKRAKELGPLIDLLKEHGCFGVTPPNMLIHVFSNGGCFQLTLLSELLRKYPTPAGATRPAVAFIFDSLPGDSALVPTLGAFTAQIRSVLLRYLIYIPLTALYVILTVISVFLPKINPIANIRRELNVPNILPWTDERTPRVYLYSSSDQIVRSSAVEGHIAEARGKGLAVRAEKFVGSAHVAHVRKDPTKYWDAVEAIWVEALNLRIRRS
ncbi:hypothetical protein M413DRAFT_440665 [Hebeloma cylindrosporum]|uniref:Uncharacterized protein n=1 Tax=Hebeloma cylindrosporum TaxID=76867 RepID=A0A0C3CEG4_HEBCY|nr:hypothetical protein M413DRAFT_440665 [Hebeloma cylindrosporum h7]